jgi:hypothetical protein
MSWRRGPRASCVRRGSARSRRPRRRDHGSCEPRVEDRVVEPERRGDAPQRGPRAEPAAELEHVALAHLVRLDVGDRTLADQELDEGLVAGHEPEPVLVRVRVLLDRGVEPGDVVDREPEALREENAVRPALRRAARELRVLLEGEEREALVDRLHADRLDRVLDDVELRHDAALESLRRRSRRWL